MQVADNPIFPSATCEGQNSNKMRIYTSGIRTSILASLHLSSKEKTLSASINDKSKQDSGLTVKVEINQASQASICCMEPCNQLPDLSLTSQISLNMASM